MINQKYLKNFIFSYPVKRMNIVFKREYIYNTQHSNNLLEIAYDFYIGGYQPAQKWLKDRKDIELGFEDIMYYNKIIVALTETDRLMKEIDNSFEI